MRKLPIILLTVLAWVVGAEAKVVYCGDVDSTGLGYTYFTDNLIAAWDSIATTTGDSVYMVGASANTGAHNILISGYNDIVTVGNGFLADVSFTGVGADNITFVDVTGWVIEDMTLRAAFDASGCTMEFDGVTIQPPDTTTLPATSSLWKFYGSAGNYTFTDCITTPNTNAPEVLYALNLSSNNAQSITLDGCTIADGLGILGDAVGDPEHIFDMSATTINGVVNLAGVTQMQRTTIDDCDLDGGIISLGVQDSLFFTDNTLTDWDQLSNASYGLRAYAKYIEATGNALTPTSSPAGATSWIGLDFRAQDDTVDSTLTGCTVSSNTVNATSYVGGSVNLYGIKVENFFDDFTLSSNTLSAGAVHAWTSDSTQRVGRSWTVTGNQILHDEADTTHQYGMMLNVNWSDIYSNTIRTPAHHMFGLLDDGVDYAWAKDSLGCHHNNVYSNEFKNYKSTREGTTRMSGVVAKGRDNNWYNNTGYQYGSENGYASMWAVSARLDTFYNWDVLSADEGTSIIFKDQAWQGEEADSNHVVNCIIRGAADYCFGSESGDTDGYSEDHNGFLLDYTTFDEGAGITMAATSTTDENSWRLKLGGDISFGIKYDSRFNAAPMGRWDTWQQAQRNVSVDPLYIGIGQPWASPKYAWSCWDSLGNAGTRLPLFELIPYGASASQLLSIELNHNLFMAEADSALVDSVWIQGTVLDKSEIYPANDAPR